MSEDVVEKLMRHLATPLGFETTSESNIFRSIRAAAEVSHNVSYQAYSKCSYHTQTLVDFKS